jgi:hypothetical protein
MTPLAPHITAFLRKRLPVDCRASEHTCDTYAHAFRLLFQYAASQLGKNPSQLDLEQIDAPLVLAFLQHIETERKNGPVTRNARLAAIKSFCGMSSIKYHPRWNRSGRFKRYRLRRLTLKWWHISRSKKCKPY